MSLGTDPQRADGDGVPDGRDPAPLAPPRADAGAGEAAAEILRYATLFLIGGPLTWQGDRALWGESPSAVGLLLHLPPESDADDQECSLARPRRRDGDDGPRGPRTPFPIASVQSLQVSGDVGKGRFIWSGHGSHHTRDLDLARVRGRWRVVDDHPARGNR